MTPRLDFEKVAETGPQPFSFSLQLGSEELDRQEIAAISPARAEGVVEPGEGEGEFLVRGSVDYQADLHCSRCLEPFPFAIHSEFTLRYVPPAAWEGLGGVEELEIAPEDLDQEVYREPAVELRPIVLEQVQLSLPMKPLCEEGCLGLCPDCGTNRNRGACECAGEESDPRWDALRGIREQLSKKKDV
ncbi:MAG TPA: DUF177 domain-containing protein [Thermoanaerobaculia bacterium]|nr:DUF177 domain-containing protein [Thermoanaerobaculia bacterium]